MNLNITVKIIMNDGKEIVFTYDEAKELLRKLKDIFPEWNCFPAVEPLRWWEKAWYSNTTGE